MKNSHIFMWEAVECSDLFIGFTNISLRANQALGSVLGFEWGWGLKASVPHTTLLVKSELSWEFGK